MGQGVRIARRVRIARQVAIVWRPLRFASAATAVIALVSAASDFRRSVVTLGAAAAALVMARLLHALRWPRFTEYLKAIEPVGAPRDWQPGGPDDSASYLAWRASVPTLTKWVEGRQSRGHRFAAMGLSYGSRGMARQAIPVGTLPGTSARAFIAEMSTAHLADFAAPSSELADRLAPDELTVLRRTGQLPAWYWTELAQMYASTH